MIVERNLAVPMRDGVLLRADVYRPKGDGRAPAVLGRTPYDRSFGPTPCVHSSLFTAACSSER